MVVGGRTTMLFWYYLIAMAARFGSSTPSPTMAPSPGPSAAPSATPSLAPSSSPTSTPAPSPMPTSPPTETPSAVPTPAPSNTPAPSGSPTPAPSFVPTLVPSATPSSSPTSPPSYVPTSIPSAVPTYPPTYKPTISPAPTVPPTSIPTKVPSYVPTYTPSSAPTSEPTTPGPTLVPSSRPSMLPTLSAAPTAKTVSFDLPDVMFTFRNNSVSFFFTSFFGEYLENMTAFNRTFEVDIALIGTSNSLVYEMIEDGLVMTTPVYNNTNYVPGATASSSSLFDISTGFYRIEVLERNRDIDVISETFEISSTHLPTTTPTSAPTTAVPSSGPTAVPTSVPTTSTLVMELFGDVIDASGTTVNNTLVFDNGEAFVRGDSMWLTMRFTGPDVQAADVTVRLCRGAVSNATDPCTTEIGTLLIGVDVASQSSGVTQKFTLLDSLALADDYRLVAAVSTSSGTSYVHTGTFGIAYTSPTKAPTSSPSHPPTRRPTRDPTFAPTRVPTTFTDDVQFIDLPAFLVVNNEVNITFRFYEEYQELKSNADKEFSFQFDVILVDEDGTSQDAIQLGGTSTSPEVTLSYTPPTTLSTTSSTYFVRVIEFNHVYDQTSSTAMVLYQSIIPTRAPTTLAPTVATLYFSLEKSDGSSVDFGTTDYVSPGDTVTLFIQLTGDLKADDGELPVATMRLCEGTQPSVTDSTVCTGDDIKDIVVAGVNITGAGRTISYTMPSNLASGSDYYFATYIYYTDVDRRALLQNEVTDPSGADEIFFSDAFLVEPFAPTETPTYGPTPTPTRVPSPKPTRSPSYQPTGEPTYKPTGRPSVEPSIKPTGNPTYKPTFQPSLIPSALPSGCGVHFDPTPSVWVVGETVTITVVICEDQLDGTGYMDLLLYEGTEANILAESLDPVAEIATNVAILEESLIFKYDVPTTVTVASDYRLRVIEYGHGLSAVSSAFTIQMYAPTVAPTLSPTNAGINILVGGAAVETSQVFVQGETITAELQWTGSTWPFDDSTVGVTVRLCSDDDCVQTVKLSVDLSEGSTTDSFTATINADPGDGYVFLMQVEETGDMYVSASFTIADYAPTVAPTLPAPSPRPSPKPTTSAPTTTGIKFSPQPDDIWLVGSTVDVTLSVAGGSVSDGVVDLLLYENQVPDSTTYATPAATLASYAAFDGRQETFQYTVSVSAGTYQLRAIEYTLGLEATSEIFEIAEFAPSYSPTAMPISPTAATLIVVESSGTRLMFDADDVLVANTAYNITVMYSPSSDGALVTVTLCKVDEIVDGLCESVLDTVAVAVPPYTTVSYTPSTTIVARGLLAFQLWDGASGSVTHTGTFTGALYAPSASPVAVTALVSVATDSPVPVPSAQPIMAPTTAGLQISVDTMYWTTDTTRTVHLQLTGIGDDLSTAYVDVYLYDASDSTKTPILPVLATGAEMTDGVLVVAYNVPASLELGSRVLRAAEYTYGYVAEINVVVTNTFEPTLQPAIDPTYAPSPMPSTPMPSHAPTASRLTASITVSNATLPEFVMSTSTAHFDFAFSGYLIRASGYLTLRVCGLDNDDAEDHAEYNGAAADSPYESCDPVLDTVVYARAFDRTIQTTYDFGDLTSSSSSYAYFRADTLIDRNSDHSVWAASNTYTLAYESSAFRIVSLLPTPAPTIAEDSLSWYKQGEPEKDCAWVSRHTTDDDNTYPRCQARGNDGNFAYEACRRTCADYVP